MSSRYVYVCMYVCIIEREKYKCIKDELNLQIRKLRLRKKIVGSYKIEKKNQLKTDK